MTAVNGTTEMMTSFNENSGDVTLSPEDPDNLTQSEEDSSEVITLNPIERFNNMSGLDRWFYLPTYFAYRCPLEMAVYCEKWVPTEMDITHWGRVTHIYVNKLSHHWCQAIILSNVCILSTGAMETNFIETDLIEKMRFKLSSAKWRYFCLSLNVLTLK